MGNSATASKTTEWCVGGLQDVEWENEGISVMLSLDATSTVLTMDSENSAVMTIDSGETIRVQTLDCFSNTVTTEKDLFSSVGWDHVNPATGPIFINGASPGDTLQVEILEIEVGDEGTMTTHPDLGLLPGTIAERTKKIPIVNGTVKFDDSYSFKIEPMIGVIGTAPKGNAVPTGTPFDHGGNMDTKKISAGSTLYLPVEVSGALLALGDVHAAMGDGEVAVCGLEIPAHVTLRVSLLEGRPVPTPFLVTEDEVISIASRESLFDAVRESTRMMRDFLVKETRLDATEATMLLSLRGNCAISQVVDPMMTARMEVPRDLFAAYEYTGEVKL